MNPELSAFLLLRLLARRQFGALALMLFTLVGCLVWSSQANAVGLQVDASSVYRLICSVANTANLPVSIASTPSTFLYNPNGKDNVTNNPVGTTTVTMTLNGCSLHSPSVSFPQGLYFLLPPPGNAIYQWPFGVFTITSVGTPTFSITSGGVGASGCSITPGGSVSAVTNPGSAGAVYFSVSFMNSGTATTTFTNCNLTMSYTLGYYSNSQYPLTQFTSPSANFQGQFQSFDAGVGNAMGWGQIQTAFEFYYLNLSYSYQFSGAAFNMAWRQCTSSVTVNGSTNTTVTLPAVSASKLSAPGATAGTTPFTIGFNSCSNVPNGASANAYWAYTPYSGTTNVIDNTGAAPKATKVGIQITDPAGNPIVANAVNSTTAWTFNGGTSDNKTFNAIYYTIGTPVTGGNVTGVVNYTLNYN